MKRLFAMIMAILVVLSTTGCGGANQDEDTAEPIVSLVVIIGKHANAQLYSGKMLNDLRALVRRSVSDWRDDGGRFRAEAHVSVIVSDGKPEVVSLPDGVLDFRSYEGYEYNLGNEIEAQTENFIDYLLSDEMKANNPQVDLLDALVKAQRLLLSESDEFERHIFILDTGICTSGKLDMQDDECDLTKKEIPEIISYLGKSVPDLTGITVSFRGLGTVADPQPEPKDEAAEKLVDLWTNIIEHAGKGVLAKPLFIDIGEGNVTMEYNEEGTGYPPVSSVFFPQPDGTIGIPVYSFGSGDVYKIFGSGLFEGDKAVPLDAEAMDNTIKNLLPAIAKLPTATKIYVVGSTAAVDPDTDKKNFYISVDRAKYIQDMLIANGVPANRIIAIGTGTTILPWRNAYEELNKPNQNNRVVAVFGDDNTEAVQALRDTGWID